MGKRDLMTSPDLVQKNQHTEVLDSMLYVIAYEQNTVYVFFPLKKAAKL